MRPTLLFAAFLLTGCNAFTDLDAIELADTGMSQSCESHGATCNPVERCGCTDDSVCALRLVGSGETTRLVPSCLDASVVAGDGGVGQTCGADTPCRPGLHCVNWTEPVALGRQCSPFCVLDTGEGCDEERFCTNPFGEALDVYGICAERCDPMADACPDGQTCGADPLYPDATPQPHFRCVPAGAFPGKSVGDPCTPEDTGEDGCPADLLCYPTPRGGGTCVRPCDSDGACPTGTCSEPTGAWELRACG